MTTTLFPRRAARAGAALLLAPLLALPGVAAAQDLTGAALTPPSPYAVPVPGTPNPGVADWVAYFSQRAAASQAQARADLSGADAMTRISTNWAEARLRAAESLPVPQLPDLPSLPDYQLSGSLGVYQNVDLGTLEARFGARTNSVQAISIPTAAELLPSAEAKQAFLNAGRSVDCSITTDGTCAGAISASLGTLVTNLAAGNPFYQAIQSGFNATVNNARDIEELSRQVAEINAGAPTVAGFNPDANDAKFGDAWLREVMLKEKDLDNLNKAGIYEGDPEYAALVGLAKSESGAFDAFSFNQSNLGEPAAKKRLIDDLEKQLGRPLTDVETSAVNKILAGSAKEQRYLTGAMATASKEVRDATDALSKEASTVLDTAVNSREVTREDVDTVRAQLKDEGVPDYRRDLETVRRLKLGAGDTAVITEDVAATIMRFAEPTTEGEARELGRLKQVYGTDRVESVIAAGVAQAAVAANADAITQAVRFNPATMTYDQMADGLLAAPLAMPAAGGGTDRTSYLNGLRELGITMGATYLLEQYRNPASPNLGVLGPVQQGIQLGGELVAD